MIEAQGTPTAGIGQPQNIAPAVVFLASSDSSWIIGETLYIDFKANRHFRRRGTAASGWPRPNARELRAFVH